MSEGMVSTTTTSNDNSNVHQQQHHHHQQQELGASLYYPTSSSQKSPKATKKVSATGFLTMQRTSSISPPSSLNSDFGLDDNSNLSSSEAYVPSASSTPSGAATSSSLSLNRRQPQQQQQQQTLRGRRGPAGTVVSKAAASTTTVAAASAAVAEGGPSSGPGIRGKKRKVSEMEVDPQLKAMRDKERRNSNNNRERIRIRDINDALTELGRLCMSLRPGYCSGIKEDGGSPLMGGGACSPGGTLGAVGDKPQTKLGVLNMAVEVITQLEREVRERNLSLSPATRAGGVAAHAAAAAVAGGFQGESMPYGSHHDPTSKMTSNRAT